jgi:hypothetical protein
MSYPSEEDLDNLPMVYFCKDEVWDPTVMDDEFDEWEEELASYGNELSFSSPVNDHGELIELDDRETVLDDLIHDANRVHMINEGGVEVVKEKPKYEAMRRHFLWIPIERIKKTLSVTTQFARSIGRVPFRKHYKTRWPAANVDRYNDDVATDTLFRTPRL